uniref:Clusterin n=1 Tax=Tetraodon nigroviridis TaxID=99883 RepID=H3DMS8_TETNG
QLCSMVLVVTVGILHSTSEDLPSNVSEDTLKELSVNGEKLVNDEVKRALYGVKQMREVMWRNAQKHQHLMASLAHSKEKKKEADKLAKEVTEKLEEAEEQCRESLQAEWEECRPCLEDTCKNFYASTCRRGFATFHAKVENFFRRVSSRFGNRERRADRGDILVNQDLNDTDAQVVRIEESFNRLVDKKTFLKDLDAPTKETSEDPYSPDRDSGFLQGVGLEEVLGSFYDFGKSVLDEFGAVVTQVFGGISEVVQEEKKNGNDAVLENSSREKFSRFLQNRKLCRDLRKQSSECWQLQSQCEVCHGALLTECPSVRELHLELDEVFQLLDVSKDQYDEILSIVQHHADETVNWLSNMAAEFSWVGQTLSNSSTDPQSIFVITKVAPKSPEEQNMTGTDTKVVVHVLNSPPLIVSVPGELELQDPAFIQYVTQEALNSYKDMIRWE